MVDDNVSGGLQGKKDKPYYIHLESTETPGSLTDECSSEKQFLRNCYGFYLCFGIFVRKMLNGLQIQREDSSLIPMLQPNQSANNS